MKLSCPSCGAKYSIADEKVQDRLAKIRCRKCSATIIVDGKVTPPNVYTSEGSNAGVTDAGDGGGGAAAGPGEYSVDFGDNDQRTMSLDDIAAACRRGEITAEMFVWSEGMADWSPVGSVPELAGFLSAAPAAAPRAAARSGAGRGSATDLFGGIETAGSEEDVMTSAPQPHAPTAPAATGARNESSVLFSLSALTASAPAAAPGPSKSTVSTPAAADHDSGLIDLKALTSSVSAQAPMNPLSLGTAPLGMAAPLGGMTAPAMPSEGPAPKSQGSKTGMYLAAAVLLVGAMIAGAIVFTGGNKEGPSAASSALGTPAAVAPTPEKVAEAPKKEEPTAEPPATGTATPEAAPTATAKAVVSPPKSGGTRVVKAKASSPAAEKPSAPTPAPAAETSDEPKKKKKKEKTCNCGPGDLMCAMKCAAG